MLFFLISIGSINICAQSFDNGQEIYLKNFKGKKTKDWTGDINGDTPIRRSISFQPIYAYLYNNVISLDFKESLPAVAISVTCEATGKTIYAGCYNNPNSLTIDLDAKSNDCYIIVIESDDLLLEGNFIL